MNASDNQATALEEPAEATTDALGTTPRRDAHRDLANLASQVQMMSDSLAACKQMAKPRPLRKAYGVKGNARPEAAAPRTSAQALSPDENALADRADQEEGGVIVSYMLREVQKPKKSGSAPPDGCRRRPRGTEDSLELFEGSSEIQMYDHGEVHPSRMVDVIRRELEALTEMAPPVAVLATALSDTIRHYQECDSCSRKISPSLPWILSRIQKLVKYVTTQRQGTYRWPDDRSYLRLRPAHPTPTHHPPPTASGRLIAKSDRLEPLSAPEDIPGLQLLLELRPDTAPKRLFDKADHRTVSPPPDSFLTFSLVHLTQSKTLPLVQVLLPDHHPDILLDEKREALTLTEFAHAPLILFAFPHAPSASLLHPTPLATLTRTRKPHLPLGPGSPDRSHDNHLPPTVPEVVREFLREARQDKMHDETMRTLEAGAKGLRDLMTEVHRNQVELSKLLLEKGVYPQPIIKLTDPDMLDRETEVMRRVADLQGPGPNSVSVEALQTVVDDVKHRCALKNRVILIILKGLRSDIPKEWWEDMVEYVLEEWRPAELCGAPGSAGKEEQAARLQARGAGAEERPPAVKNSAEEAKARGSEGAEGPCGAGTSMTKLEKQVSLLNAENERLRHEVEELKDLVRSSVEELRERRVCRDEWEQRPSGRVSGKTINLTIEIVEKEFGGAGRKMSVAGGPAREGRCLEEAEAEAEAREGRAEGLRGRGAEAGRLLQKPSVMELVESRRAGPVASMGIERELQTIPENECGPSAGSSKGMSQAIERLRSRVRSIHKDVAVLKSKNDRIDKLLDRLMDDAVENGESFEEMESDLKRFKEQLG